MSLPDRLLPRQADNRYEGVRAALWLLWLLVALKLIMSVRSILSTASVATGDGIPLAGMEPAAARELLTLFALMALAQLTLSLVALVVLLRYRALISFIYLMLLGEALVRRLIVQSQAAARAETGAGIAFLTWGLLALTAIGLVLSLIPARGERIAGSG